MGEGVEGCGTGLQGVKYQVPLPTDQLTAL